MAGPVKFVILSQPRTGSTLVCSLLNSHPGIRALVEPINPETHGHHMRPIRGSRHLLPEAMIQNDLQRALHILFSSDPPSRWISSGKQATRAAGFKIMAHQIMGLRSEPVFWKYLDENHVKVILVFRYNILMQYVSDLITIATRQSACWDGNVLTAKVEVPIDTLESALRRIITEKRYLIDRVNELGLDKRRIRYEEFMYDYGPVERLLPWLIGETCPLTTRLHKQNPDSLKARVTNYGAMAAEVRRLGLGHLLVDEIGERYGRPDALCKRRLLPG